MNAPPVSIAPAANDNAVGARAVAAAWIFLHMLPLTMLTPAVRPLFALVHRGNESAMHAFMSVNMLGAALAAAALATRPRARDFVAEHLHVLVAIDAALVASFPLLPSTGLLLAARMMEGALHVTTATLLLAATGDSRSKGRNFALSGAALGFSIALGSTIGGLFVALSPRAPFFAAAALLALVAFGMPPARLPHRGASERRDAARSPGETWGGVALPSAAAFVGRFVIGCLVVSFALFAHKAHAFSDREVGLLFTAMTLPFALAMYPFMRLSRARGAVAVLFSGALSSAPLLLLLGRTPKEGVALVMVALGVASAAMFAGVLVLSTRLRDGTPCPRALAWVNGAGCIGMLVGPAAAGITCAALSTVEDPCRGYRGAFLLAAFAVLVFCVVAGPALRAAARRGAADREVST